jgi:hypothetical protein
MKPFRTLSTSCLEASKLPALEALEAETYTYGTNDVSLQMLARTE